MSLSLFVQAILAGVTNGFVYALIGLGMTVIFRGTRIINAMQGEFAVIAGMGTVSLLEAGGLGVAAAVAASLLLALLIGIFVELVLVRPMMRTGAPEESYFLLTVGLAYLNAAVLLYMLGKDPQMLPGIGGTRVFWLLGATLPVHAVALIVIALMAMAALRLFFTRTMTGLSMMAAAIDQDGAATIGINVGIMRIASFGLGGLLGAGAGILITPLTTMQYQMGVVFTLKGFAAAVLGGLTNPMGALLGGLTLGLVESLAIVGVSSGYKDAIALTVLIVMMVLRPFGLLGQRERQGG